MNSRFQKILIFTLSFSIYTNHENEDLADQHTHPRKIEDKKKHVCYCELILEIEIDYKATQISVIKAITHLDTPTIFLLILGACHHFQFSSTHNLAKSLTLK